MAETNQSHTTPRDVARVLFRHQRRILLVFCSIVALTLLAIALWPRSYSSEAKLVIRVGRESVGLDPTATTGSTIMLQKTQEDEVNSALDILNSRQVLQRVVDIVGAKRILDKPPVSSASSASGDKSTDQSTASGPLAWIDWMMRSVRLADPASDSDLAIRRLNSRIKVTAPKQSTIITVGYSASSPELAHDVVEAVTSVFLEEHVRLNQSDGSLQFFAEQVDKLHQELVTKQAELRDRKNAFQLTSSDKQPSVVEKAKEAMRQQIFELQTEESDLKSRYTDEYPLLRQIRQQREQAVTSLIAMSASGPQTGIAANDNSRQADENRVKATVASNEIPVRPDAASVQDGRMSAELQTLNDQSLQLSQLERDVELLDGKYRMHVEKLEQARVNEAMSRERITNIKIAQPATFVAKATWPNKSLLLVLGLTLAICGAFGSAVGAESLDQTLRTKDQVESELGLPVVLSLPHRKRRNRGGHSSSDTYGPLLRELLPTDGNGDRHAKSVGVIGCDTSKLRSRVAAELAIRASNSGNDPVLLIDADSQHRNVAKRFHLNGSPGWRDILAGKADAASCIHRPELENLAVMTAGETNGVSRVSRPAAELQHQLDELKDEYGLIVVDLPSARDLDASSAAPEWLDEMVLVVDAERTRMQTALQAKELLKRAGVRLTGVVLANRREHVPQWLYQRL
jgi:polysaccharide biosynthesis transport protein